MLVSIIIPAYNRERMIVQTLASLIEMDFPKEDFEIIVSDNNSTDNTAGVVKEFIEKNKDHNVVYFLEKRQGVHYARNSAAKKSKGKYLYFTDDDMIADKALLKELLVCFQVNDKVASATGKVIPKWEQTPPDWILRFCNNSLLSLNDPNYDFLISDDDCNVFSCHQMMRRDVFFQSGGFNPENTQGQWIGDGETGLNIKIKQLGYKFAFNKKSVIQHIIPKERLTQEYLNKRFFNQGNCDSYTYYRENKPSDKQLLRGIIDKYFMMIKSYLNSVYLKLRGTEYWRLSRSKYYYWKARILYDRKICNDPSWKELVLKSNWIDED